MGKLKRGKYSHMDDYIMQSPLIDANLAKELKVKFSRPESENALRKRIALVREYYLGKDRPAFDFTTLSGSTEVPEESLENDSTSESKTEGYGSQVSLMPSAWCTDKNGYLSIDEYCDKYGLPKHLVKSSKLISHIGSHMVYNIVFKEEIIDEDFDYIGALQEAYKKYRSTNIGKHPGKGTGVITITDLHFGAYVTDLQHTQDFDIHILIDMLERASDQVNRFQYERVHVHILGDLIESFTGMNHPNTWHSLKHGMIGANVIKAFTDMIDRYFLTRINNLVDIKIVAGNHDRGTSRNDEDQKGWAADLVAWALKLMNYDVEFSSSIITHEVDNIVYILNHDHLGLTKMSTEEICWNYGKKGKYNFLMEGHLHSRIAKLNAKTIKKFELITDDTIDCRRQVCPSMFTGNSWSEAQGFSTKAGYIITENNGYDGVNVFDFSL